MGLIFDKVLKDIKYEPMYLRYTSYMPVDYRFKTISPSLNYVYSPQLMLYSPYGSQTKKESSLAETSANYPVQTYPTITMPSEVKGSTDIPIDTTTKMSSGGLLIAGLVVIGGIILLKMFSD